jgi:shikimate 5-dehydrogenase
MAPDRERSPLARESLVNFRWVMDLIYNPLKTKLLRDAEEAGCMVLSGVGMFVHQGAEQIKIWKGVDPPRAFMKQIVLERLKKGDGN